MSEPIRDPVLSPSVSVTIDDHMEKKIVSPKRRREILTLLRKHLPALIKERSLKIDENAKYAKLCVLDAFQGRLSNGLATNSKKSKLMFTIFSFQTSESFMNTVVISSFLHTISVFMEPVKGCSSSNFMFMFHVVVALIHFADLILKMSYEGFWNYWSHDWQRLYLITITSNIIDLAINGCTTYTNFLRPVVWLLRARSGRRFFTIVQKMIPGLTQSLMPMFVFLIILVVTCFLFFDRLLDKYLDAPSSSYNWFWMIYTNDTYGTLFPPELYKDILFILFFFSAIFVGQKFLLSLILGATFDTFRAFTKKQLKDERIKEIQGLVKAFTALDDQKAGFITEPVFRALLSHYNPSLGVEEKSLYFELISSGMNSGVTLLQFINLRDIETYKFNRVNYAAKIQENVGDFVNSVGSKIRIPMLSNLSPALKSIYTAIEKYNVRDHVNMFDMCALVCGLQDFLPSPYLPITPCNLITSFYGLEFYSTLAAADGHLWTVLDKQELWPKEFIFSLFGILIYYVSPLLLLR